LEEFLSNGQEEEEDEGDEEEGDEMLMEGEESLDIETMRENINS